ncbi:sortilin-related receptor [Tetranychus urticae]|uniref:VPS10 domain-containing protein n=1 Tax=Tetranychus urticae TaxID=32264 RepID=T1L009_TETUR|nr:sortilin-related receptor [Tetranychus urticae]
MAISTSKTISTSQFITKVIFPCIFLLSGLSISLALIDGTVKISNKSSKTTTSPPISSHTAPFITRELHKIISLDDNHDQLVIDQSGSTILCLTKSTNSSNFYLSYDEGSTYHKIHGLQVNDSQKAVVSSFFHHPTIPGHIILTDVNNKLIFVSSRAGQEFEKIKVSFKPSLIVYSPYSVNWIAAYDEDDGFLQIWISSDGGFNWHAVTENVKQFAWGSVQQGETIQTLFLITESRNGGSTLSILTMEAAANKTLKVKSTRNVLTNIEKFILHNRYIFAVRKSAKFGSTNHQSDRELWLSVSGDANFNKVILPITNKTCLDYQLIDITSHFIMMGVVHSDLTSDLLISDSTGVEFKLSLQNVFHKSSKSTKQLNPINQGTIDVHKVEGLEGVYIASKGNSFEESVSVITYNYGATWSKISWPKDLDGKELTCNQNCSFHLTHLVNSTKSNYHPPSLSKESAVGLILSPGIISSTKNASQTSTNYYVSSDAGLSFIKTSISERYFVDIIDSGSIIVAVKSYLYQEGSSEILYSLDYGSSWRKLPFTDRNVSVYHLMPLNEGRSLSFILLCLNSSQLAQQKKGWIVVRIDLSSIMNKPCTNDDYQLWTPHEPDSKCLLGSEMGFQRKKININCSNYGRDLNKPIRSNSCNCVPSDYQCDFGYTYNISHSVCQQTDPGSDAPPEETCQLGKAYLKTKGYTKVFGNRCKQGIDNLEPESLICGSENSGRHTKKQMGLNGIGTLLAFLIMTILCFIVVGLIVLCQGCPCDRTTQVVRSNYHVSPSDSNRYAINVTFDNKTLRSDYEYSDDEPLVQA